MRWKTKREAGRNLLRRSLANFLSSLLLRFRRRSPAPPSPIGMLDLPLGTTLQQVFDAEDDVVIGNELQNLMLHLSHVDAASPNTGLSRDSRAGARKRSVRR